MINTVKAKYFDFKKFMGNFSPVLLFIIGVLGVLLMVYDIGFSHSERTNFIISQSYYFIFYSYLIIKVVLFLLRFIAKEYKLKELISHILLFAVLIFFLKGYSTNFEFLGFDFIWKNDFLIYPLLFLIFFIELSNNTLGIAINTLSPTLTLALSFLLIILIGTGLLLLPNATTNSISFIDAFFTATSATCIVGLTVVDTQHDFTLLGQSIILLLFQIGGLGIMTITSFTALIFSGSNSFGNMLLLKDMVSSNKVGEVFKSLQKVILFTLSIELIGIVLIFATINTDLTDLDLLKKDIYFSVFHGVSAFCNAGFSTLSDGLNSEIIKTNFAMHIVVIIIVILGGLGFHVLVNLYSSLKRFLYNLNQFLFHKEDLKYVKNELKVETKLILSFTITLYVLGAILFLFLQSDNNIYEGEKWWEKTVSAIFVSISARQVGFNTVDVNLFSTPVILVLMFLMWVGASPSSTGGGIKITTFALGILNIFSLSKGKDRVEVFGREISNKSVRNAFSVIFLSIILIGSSTILLMIVEPHIAPKKLIFDIISAATTTGLSVGATAELSTLGKFIFIVIMFFGRVGLFGIMIGLIKNKKNLSYRYPEEEIRIF